MLASRQGIIDNRTVIATAQRLYFDYKNNRPRLDASGYLPELARAADRSSRLPRTPELMSVRPEIGIC